MPTVCHSCTVAVPAWTRSCTEAKVLQTQVKCLRVLQYFPVPEDPVVYKGLEEVLKRIITGEHYTQH